VPQCIRHAFQHGLIGPAAAFEIENTSQAAHRRLLRAKSGRGL